MSRPLFARWMPRERWPRTLYFYIATVLIVLVVGLLLLQRALRESVVVALGAGLGPALYIWRIWPEPREPPGS